MNKYLNLEDLFNKFYVRLVCLKCHDAFDVYDSSIHHSRKSKDGTILYYIKCPSCHNKILVHHDQRSKEI